MLTEGLGSSGALVKVSYSVSLLHRDASSDSIEPGVLVDDSLVVEVLEGLLIDFEALC